MTPAERAEIRHGTTRLGLAVELAGTPKVAPPAEKPTEEREAVPVSWRAHNIRALRFAGKRGMSLQWMARTFDRTTAEIDLALWEAFGRPDWQAAQIMNRRGRPAA